MNQQTPPDASMPFESMASPRKRSSYYLSHDGESKDGEIIQHLSKSPLQSSSIPEQEPRCGPIDAFHPSTVDILPLRQSSQQILMKIDHGTDVDSATINLDEESDASTVNLNTAMVPMHTMDQITTTNDHYHHNHTVAGAMGKAIPITTMGSHDHPATVHKAINHEPSPTLISNPNPDDQVVNLSISSPTSPTMDIHCINHGDTKQLPMLPALTQLDPNELTDYLKWKLPTTADALGCYEGYISSLINSSDMLSLQQLLLCVSWLLRDGRMHANLEMIECVMQRYNAELGEYHEFMHYDPAASYTRNLIATDDKHWTMMVICWNPHSESYIHNHPECECYVRSLCGDLAEYRYHHPMSNSTITEPGVVSCEDKDCEKHRQKLVCYQRTDIPSGTVSFMNDSLGLHKIANETDHPAATLHLYFPPYKSCKIYINSDSVATISNVCYYTKHGQRVDYNLDTTSSTSKDHKVSLHKDSGMITNDEDREEPANA